MNAHNRRLAYRVKNIVRDHGQESLELVEFAADHPITMRLLLNRLKKDNEIAVALAEAACQAEKQKIEPLLGPGDPEIEI